MTKLLCIIMLCPSVLMNYGEVCISSSVCILMVALQQHLKALASRTAHYAVCATSPGEPSGLLPVTDKTWEKSSISSVLQLAHGSTERLLAVKVREVTLAELELSKPRGVLCCLTICASHRALLTDTGASLHLGTIPTPLQREGRQL